MSNTKTSHVISLLAYWEEQKVAGNLLTPEELCRTSPELLDQVKSQLKLLQDFPSQLIDTGSTEQNASDTHVQHREIKKLNSGSVVAGRYTLLALIGEGGMGSVWCAEQTEPVKRQVALKLIRSSSYIPQQVIRRFEAERQALALMDHPNIARIYDGGITEWGEPYFVMELVQGMPLTQFCDKQRLNVKGRLELFITICQAVQHAHQKGIIHRDLKPGNILVANIDGVPLAKVIDFGVAKATDQQLTEGTLIDNGIVGTLAYMSPEQAEAGDSNIDTRTDIYSLGVILYELLAGSTPFSSDQLHQMLMYDMYRQVRDVDPPRLATKISQSNNLTSLAATRDTEPSQLEKTLRGDLEWIVLKALEKDRTRRYDTANSLAADIQRYLKSEPVLAHPPSKSYLAKKFVKRHKVQVAAAGLVLASLITGLVASIWQMNRAIDAESIAKTRERQAMIAKDLTEEQRIIAEKNKKQAEEQRDIALAVRDFLRHQLISKASVWDQSALASQQPGSVRHDITVRELLEKAALEFSPQKINEKFPHQPEVQRELLQTIAIALNDTGNNRKGIEYLKAAIEISEKSLGFGHPDTFELMAHLALFETEAGKHINSISIVGKMVAQLLRMMLDQSSHTMEDQPGKCLDRTIKLFDQRLDGRQQPLPAFSGSLKVEPLSLFQAGITLLTIKDNVDQISALAVRQFGAEHRRTMFIRLMQGIVYHARNQITQAIDIYEQLLQTAEAKKERDTKLILGVRQLLLKAYRVQERKPDFIYQHAKKLFADYCATFGPHHANTLVVMKELAECSLDIGKYDQALTLLDNALTPTQAMFGVDHLETLACMNLKAKVYEKSGRLDQAIVLYEETLQLARKRFGNEHTDTMTLLENLARSLQKNKQYARALPHFEEILKYRQKNLRTNHPNTLSTMQSLAQALRETRQFTKAIELYQTLWEARKRSLPENHDQIILAENLLGWTMAKDGKFSEAEKHLLNSYQNLTRSSTAPKEWRTTFCSRLTYLYEQWKKPEELKKWQTEKDSLKIKN
ncbi:MAG: serine/threonine protein kinase [Planctomycetia bacterium]|nr:serine/threonine protein kinase [Planctomycetia bacterium]